MDLAVRMKGSSPPLLWDGGIGTSLGARGLDLGREPPEAWLISHPAQVQAVHEEFAAAGVDVLQTNTFGLLRLHLLGELPAPLPDLVARAVLSCRQAASIGDRSPQIVASLGPSGLRSPDPGRISAACTEIAGLFLAAGITAIHLETFYDPGELQAALGGVRAASTAVELLASVTVNLGNSGLETPLGTPLAYILRVMEREGPDVIGVNCSQNARRMRLSVEALVRFAGGRIPVLAQPQLGQQGAECRGSTRPESTAQFVHGIRSLLEAGADAVGGCCGCTGEYLGAVRQALDQGRVRPVTATHAEGR